MTGMERHLWADQVLKKEFGEHAEKVTEVSTEVGSILEQIRPEQLPAAQGGLEGEEREQQDKNEGGSAVRGVPAREVEGERRSDKEHMHRVGEDSGEKSETSDEDRQDEEKNRGASGIHEVSGRDRMDYAGQAGQRGDGCPVPAQKGAR